MVVKMLVVMAMMRIKRMRRKRRSRKRRRVTVVKMSAGIAQSVVCWARYLARLEITVPVGWALNTNN